MKRCKNHQNVNRLIMDRPRSEIRGPPVNCYWATRLAGYSIALFIRAPFKACLGFGEFPLALYSPVGLCGHLLRFQGVLTFDTFWSASNKRWCHLSDDDVLVLSYNTI